MIERRGVEWEHLRGEGGGAALLGEEIGLRLLFAHCFRPPAIWD